MGSSRPDEQVDPDQLCGVPAPWDAAHVVERPLLGDAPAFEDHHVIGEGHRFDRVVGHEHADAGERRERLDEDRAELRSTSDVQSRRRFIEEEESGMVDDRAGERHPLGLAPGERRRQGVRSHVGGEEGEGGARRLVCVPLADATSAERERHVREHGQVGEERAVLEGDARVAVAPGEDRRSAPRRARSSPTLSIRPASAETTVVFPEPFGPRSASVSPSSAAIVARTSNEPRSAAIVARRLMPSPR